MEEDLVDQFQESVAPQRACLGALTLTNLETELAHIKSFYELDTKGEQIVNEHGVIQALYEICLESKPENWKNLLSDDKSAQIVSAFKNKYNAAIVREPDPERLPHILERIRECKPYRAFFSACLVKFFDAKCQKKPTFQERKAALGVEILAYYYVYKNAEGGHWFPLMFEKRLALPLGRRTRFPCAQHEEAVDAAAFDVSDGEEADEEVAKTSRLSRLDDPVEAQKEAQARIEEQIKAHEAEIRKLKAEKRERQERIKRQKGSEQLKKAKRVVPDFLYHEEIKEKDEVEATLRRGLELFKEDEGKLKELVDMIKNANPESTVDELLKIVRDERSKSKAKAVQADGNKEPEKEHEPGPSSAMPPTVTVNEVLADPPPVDTLNESENNEEQETDDPMHPGVSEN